MQPQVLTKKEFNDKYWFTPYHMVEVTNPKATDFHFMVEMRPFVVKAGEKIKIPGAMANVYLPLMAKILAQDDNKLEYMSDPNLMVVYYNKLIVSVENLVPEMNNTPPYLKDVPEHMNSNVRPDVPNVAPWEQIPDNQVKVPETPTKPQNFFKDPVTDDNGNTTREFVFNGLTFKSITDKDDNVVCYKNDMEIDEEAYSKAASMV